MDFPRFYSPQGHAILPYSQIMLCAKLYISLISHFLARGNVIMHQGLVSSKENTKELDMKTTSKEMISFLIKRKEKCELIHSCVVQF